MIHFMDFATCSENLQSNQERDDSRFHNIEPGSRFKNVIMNWFFFNIEPVSRIFGTTRGFNIQIINLLMWPWGYALLGVTANILFVQTNYRLTQQHLSEVDMRSVKRECRLKCVSNHDKGNGDVMFRNKEPPKWLHKVKWVRHILKHHLMLFATQYTPLGSQAPEVISFWRCSFQSVLIGPHKTVVGVRGVDHTKSPVWTVYWSCYEVIYGW